MSKYGEDLLARSALLVDIAGSVVDALEDNQYEHVVYCGQCRHWRKASDRVGRCKYQVGFRELLFYCTYGEKKGADDS